MNKPTIESRKCTLDDVFYSFVRMSGNRKIGYMPAGYSSFLTCWNECTFGKHGACYAKGGHCQMHMHKVTSGARGGSFAKFVEQIDLLPDDIVYRPMVGGDLPGINGELDKASMLALVDANRNRRGKGHKRPIGYTHSPVMASQAPCGPANAAIIKHANKNGFTINLSANTVNQADALVDLEIGPVVCVLPKGTIRKTYTPKGRAIVVCPAVLAGKLGTVTCSDCLMCSKVDRPYLIGFPAHGMREAIAHKIAIGELL